jgi:hypothetical protein
MALERMGDSISVDSIKKSFKYFGNAGEEMMTPISLFRRSTQNARGEGISLIECQEYTREIFYYLVRLDDCVMECLPDQCHGMRPRLLRDEKERIHVESERCHKWSAWRATRDKALAREKAQNKEDSMVPWRR